MRCGRVPKDGGESVLERGAFDSSRRGEKCNEGVFVRTRGELCVYEDGK